MESNVSYGEHSGHPLNFPSTQTVCLRIGHPIPSHKWEVLPVIYVQYSLANFHHLLLSFFLGVYKTVPNKAEDETLWNLPLWDDAGQWFSHETSIFGGAFPAPAAATPLPGASEGLCLSTAAVAGAPVAVWLHGGQACVDCRIPTVTANDILQIYTQQSVLGKTTPKLCLLQTWMPSDMINEQITMTHLSQLIPLLVV